MHVLQYPQQPRAGVAAWPSNEPALSAQYRRTEDTGSKPYGTSVHSMSDATTARRQCVKSLRAHTFELKALPRSLPRTEAQAIETTVLTYRLLKHAGLPVPTVVHLKRSTPSEKVVSAYINRPDGVALSSVNWPGTDPRLLYALAQINSAKSLVASAKSSLFGPVAAVAAGRGSPSWSLAFALMFEALLEDGEDQFVNVPYSDIRALLLESRSALEEIKRPQLVIPALASASSILVDPATGAINAFLGCRDAYWADPDLFSSSPSLPVYRCYGAVKTIIEGHFRPSSAVGTSLVGARSTMMTALSERAPS